ncbi:DNA-binding transcription factor [Lithospermum erythrorhizon]|uniref:DNA-binding transcription factor n=1 Tax=Lithospermum erythrorhizon TaxID=34254 RepID=A0AAV3PTT3_LITER
MNHSQQTQPQQQLGSTPGGGQIAFSTTTYQTTTNVAASAGVMAVASSNQPANAFPTPAHQLSYQQPQNFHNQQHLQSFWAKQLHEVEQTTDFKNHNLPLARIKKIMKADEDVRMISAEAPVIFAKACEMFILELTLRSWLHTEENKRRTLQKNDIAAAISRTDVFDFLVDIILRDELKEEGLGLAKAALPFLGSPVDSIPYYYVPPTQNALPVVPPGIMMGKQNDQSALFAGQQTQVPLAFVPWAQPVTTSTITSDTQSLTPQSQQTTASKETE